jgi:carbonic anhydrase
MHVLHVLHLLQVMDLIPRRHAGHLPYVHYRGSLTTPPCSQGVEWLVLTDTLKVTDDQVGSGHTDCFACC